MEDSRLRELLKSEYAGAVKGGGMGYLPENPHPKHMRLLRFVFKNVPAGSQVLDVCCGQGIPSSVLSRTGYRVTVIDSKEVTKDWERRFAAKDIRCVSLHIEEERVPLPDDSVDLIYFGATLEHLHNSPQPVLKDFLRLLKPGGFLFLDVPNIVCLRNRVLMLMGRSIMPSVEYVYNSPFHAEHHREYTLEEVVKIFKWSGFEVVDSYMDDIVFRRSLIRKGKISSQREDFYNDATVWDYNLPFRPFNWFDWVKLPGRALVSLFPRLKDDIVVIGRKAKRG